MRSIVTTALFCVFLTNPVLAAPDKPDKSDEGSKKSKKSKKSKPERFCIAQRGEETFEIVAAKQAKKRARELNKEYKAALKGWTKAKSEARKAKSKFEEPRPKAPLFKVVVRGLKGQEAAQERLDKILEAIRKAKERKTKKAKKGKGSKGTR